jgi:hypothetical protein
MVTSAWGPVHLAPAQDMQVQVKNRLPGIRPGIDHQAVLPEPDFFGRFSGCQQQMAQQLRIVRLVQGGDMPARDQQNMNRSLGLQVSESDSQIILVNERGRDLAAGDLAKNA